MMQGFLQFFAVVCVLHLASAYHYPVFQSRWSANTSEKKKMVCYYGSWAGYRLGNGKFEPENINPHLCTHIIYSFVGITSDGNVRILDPWNDLPDGKDFIRRFNSHKKINPNIKTLIAIGGWNEGSVVYSQVMNDNSKRAAFVQNVVNFVKTYGFDGFDLDWEYPAQRGGVSSDKVAYTSLIKELRAEFDKYGFLLTAAVGVGRYLIDSSYELPQLSKYLDFINMMAYDLHGPWEYKTGQNAPLYASPIDVGNDLHLNVNASIWNWIKGGASREKLVLGIGTYGKTFTLSGQSPAGLGAATTGPGTAGPYTQEAGMMGYNEICEKVNRNELTVVWDDQQQVPYAYSGKQWIGYDNIKSVTLKAQFAMDLGLGGAMIWSVETDDFHGHCHGTKFPLLTAINKVLHGDLPDVDQEITSSTASITTDSPVSSTTSSGPELCVQEGFVRDSVHCNVFYQCVYSNGLYQAHRFTCPEGLLFDTTINACNHAVLVVC